MSDSPSVAELLAQWQAGDESALPLLIEHVGERVRLMARRQLGDRLRARLDSQDLAQETLLSFLRDAPSFVVQTEAQLIALLATILRNNLCYQNRHWGRQQRDLAREASPRSGSVVVFEHEGAAAQTRGPATRAGESDEAAQVQLALETLDAVDHRIVAMRIYQEASYAEIAAAVDSTEEAVRKRFARAMPQLSLRLRALRSGSMAGFLGPTPDST